MTVEPKRICGKSKMASCQGDRGITFDTHALTHEIVLIVSASSTKVLASQYIFMSSSK